MSEWVLVPIEFDSETYEEIWTAAYNEWAEFDSCYKDAGRAAVVAMFAARPPIPRAVWKAMVERGARATFLRRNGSKTSWAWDSSGLDDEHPGARARYLHDAETALRAALGNPLVEGDTP